MFKFLTTTAIVAVGVAAIPVAAIAQAQAPRVAFYIKASDTATALNQFARQAGVHVSFPYDAVAHRRAAGLRGRFTRGEALRRLIAGQGLTIAEE
ncbi:MAG: TonB-dependent receptor, partial [Lysobacteraceae bacterium]